MYTSRSIQGPSKMETGCTERDRNNKMKMCTLNLLPAGLPGWHEGQAGSPVACRRPDMTASQWTADTTRPMTGDHEGWVSLRVILGRPGKFRCRPLFTFAMCHLTLAFINFSLFTFTYSFSKFTAAVFSSIIECFLTQSNTQRTSKQATSVFTLERVLHCLVKKYELVAELSIWSKVQT